MWTSIVLQQCTRNSSIQISTKDKINISINYIFLQNTVRTDNNTIAPVFYTHIYIYMSYPTLFHYVFAYCYSALLRLTIWRHSVAYPNISRPNRRIYEPLPVKKKSYHVLSDQQSPSHVVHRKIQGYFKSKLSQVYNTRVQQVITRGFFCSLYKCVDLQLKLCETVR